MLRRPRRKLLLLSAAGPAGDADPASVQKAIRAAVQKLEKAGRSRGILWFKRSLWVFARMGAAAAGTYALPHQALDQSCCFGKRVIHCPYGVPLRPPLGKANS